MRYESSQSGSVLWRDPQLQLLWTARIDYASGSTVEAHVHSEYSQMLVIISGAGSLTIDNHTYNIKAGHAYLFLAGVAHRFHFTADTITLDYKFRLTAPEIVEALHEMPPFGRCSSSDLQELKQWYQLSRVHLKSSVPYPLIRIEAGFKGTLASLFLVTKPAVEQSLPDVGQHVDSPIAAYLRTHLAERITLQQLSNQFGFHPTYLIRIFSDQTGMTPIQYLQEVRLEKAREYLEFSSLPISEVADKVGWTLPYFSKMVKRRFGLPPLQYRNSLTNEVGEDIVLEHDFSNEWRVKR